MLALPTLLSARAPTTRKAGKTPPKTIDGAKTEIYKRVGDTELRAHIFEPEGHNPGNKRPTIVLFFGGGWFGGTPTHFEPQSRYLASRGMVAIVVDYRVYSRQKAQVFQCVSDAKSAIRWTRKNADRLGIDPERIAAGGGSAGGHLAASTGTLPKFDEPDEDKSISSRPNAMILFNPALDLTPQGVYGPRNRGKRKQLVARMGAPAEDLSPGHHIKPGTPPTVIFHGTSDPVTPFAMAEAFTAKMKKAGNRCELVGYKDQTHGFFNPNKNQGRYYRDTLYHMDRFLISIGYLEGKPTVSPAEVSRSTSGDITSRPESEHSK
jgi:acetyl esterase/lipase